MQYIKNLILLKIWKLFSNWLRFFSILMMLYVLEILFFSMYKCFHSK